MKATPTKQKLRGGYYTPQPIAKFLCKWAIRDRTTKVLEPSCGDGNVLLAATEELLQLGVPQSEVCSLIKGVEIDEVEAGSCLTRLAEHGVPATTDSVLTADFFSICREFLASRVTFDAVVGNPPFIRYQHFSEKQRTIAANIMITAGLRPSRLMNAWLPFLVGATRLLSEHGRLAMVIPAELLQVNYAAETRQFLSDNYSRITLITFRRLLFQGLQQEVVLLLGEKNGAERIGIKTIELDGVDDLVRHLPKSFSFKDLKPLDHSRDKWTQYFLTAEEILLLRQLRSNRTLLSLSDVASVDVGIVTGMNEFFVLTRQKLEEYSLQDYAVPIVARSSQFRGVIYSQADWKGHVAANARVFLLNLPAAPFESLPALVKRYIREGEQLGIHQGYKCRIRDPWYVVPSLWVPDAFLLRQVHNYPKLVLNTAKATSTDTIHRVRVKNGVKPQRLAAAFLNSMTFAFSEVMGRSYGGGVLELEPKEAESLPIALEGAERLELEEIDKIVTTSDIDAVLAITDKVLLEEGMGIPSREVHMLRVIWEKLRERRKARR